MPKLVASGLTKEELAAAKGPAVSPAGPAAGPAAAREGPKFFVKEEDGSLQAKAISKPSARPSALAQVVYSIGHLHSSAGTDARQQNR